MKRALTIGLLALSAFALITIAIIASGASPVEAYSAFLKGAFGGKAEWEMTLKRSIPLLLVGLGVAIGLRAGLFNIGAEGQLLIGALVGAWVGYALKLPTGLHLLATLLAGAVGGAIWAFPAGLIKVWRGGHEVITTIMFNYIALNLVNYMLNGPMQAVSELSAPKTPDLQQTAWMPLIPGTDNTVNFGLIIGLLLAVALWAWLTMTPKGYETQAVGANADAAEANGISVSRTVSLAMMISGALAGLAGAVQVSAEHRFYKDFSPGWGFDGLAVALLAGSNPLLVIPAAILFGGIDVGTRAMESATSVPRDIAIIIRGLVILYVAVIAWQRHRESK